MSSQASSAGGGEARVRQKLVETGDVDVMIAIRSNFFYTRTVPCELWFFDRAKPREHRGKVLMIDARHIYRKVTRKIYDFSPEQQQNLVAIVWLYRGETDKYLSLVTEYYRRSLEACQDLKPVRNFQRVVADLANRCALGGLKEKTPTAPALKEELVQKIKQWASEIEQFSESAQTATADFEASTSYCQPLASHFKLQESGHALVKKQVDLLFKLATRLIETCEQEGDAWSVREVARARKAADEARRRAVEQLKQVRYFWNQAQWLTERFPKAELRDVVGLVKLVDRADIEANDWSLTPGRYVGVAPEEVEEDFDFAQALRKIHAELEDLNREATGLAETISRNFKEFL